MTDQDMFPNQAETNRRRQSLSQSLSHRPDYDTLVHQNLTTGHSVAPSLHARRSSLQQQLAGIRVNQSLYNRPSPHDLGSRHILDESEQRMAPALQGVAHQLERRMMTDNLGHLLESRSNFDELINHHIYQDQGVAPNLQPVKHQLEMNMARTNLRHALARRPSRIELETRNILQPSDSMASGPDDDYFRTVVLLKVVSNMAKHGEITKPQKDFLKDLIVGQHRVVLAAAQVYETDQDLEDLKDTLSRIATRSQ